MSLVGALLFPALLVMLWGWWWALCWVVVLPGWFVLLDWGIIVRPKPFDWLRRWL